MKTIFLFALLFIFIIPAIFATDIGIIVELEDGTVKTDCIAVDENTNGRQILDKSVFNILWSPQSLFGSLVCKIEGEGTEVDGTFCEFSGEFWNFNILPNGENDWIHSPVGHDGPGGCWNRNEFSFGGHYCGVNKDVIGYKFGSGGDEPPLRTFEQICEKLYIKDIEAYVDGKKEAGVNEDGGDITVFPGSELRLKINVENLYDLNEDITIEDIFAQGVLEDINHGRDLVYEVHEFDLDANHKNTISLNFAIPESAIIDDYDLEIEVAGENERGFEFLEIIDFEIKVRTKKEIAILYIPSESTSETVPPKQKSSEETIDLMPFLPKIFNQTQPVSIPDKTENFISSKASIIVFAAGQGLFIGFILAVIIIIFEELTFKKWKKKKSSPTKLGK